MADTGLTPTIMKNELHRFGIWIPLAER